jgi:hypothetical protein
VGFLLLDRLQPRLAALCSVAGILPLLLLVLPCFFCYAVGSRVCRRSASAAVCFGSPARVLESAAHTSVPGTVHTRVQYAEL